MKHLKIDDIDLKILEILQKEGRISNLELSKRVQLSPPPCLRRLKALEEAGYIENYQANVSAEKLGFNVTVFVFITLKVQQQKEMNDMIAQIEKWDMVRESYMISGETDFILKVVANSWEEFNRMLMEDINAIPNVSNVRSALAIRQNKYKAGVPLNTAE
ncbi:MAG: Lrp/AsnC family transcriptional regulator [Alphaproteobacteria bacterium]